MPDTNDYIRKKLREAREEAGMTQREVAKEFGARQVTISDLERGRTKVNASDLVNLARILHKSVTYFLPGTHESDLTNEEQTLIGLFRKFDDTWRGQLLDHMEGQLTFYQALHAVEDMPDGPDKARATIEYQAEVWKADGAWVVRDEYGMPGIVATPFPAKVNKALSEGMYGDVFKWVKSLDAKAHEEASWVLLTGMLGPAGVEVQYLDEQPEIGAAGLAQYLATKEDDHREMIAELIKMAKAKVE